MSKIPLWACTACGMTSSRAESVRRHVRNLHNGQANIVPFSSYVAGINSSFYVPRPPPSFGRKKSNSPIEIFLEEYPRELVKESIRRRFSGENNIQTVKPHPQDIQSSWESWLSQNQVFGYKVFVCDQCLILKSIYVCYPREANQSARSEFLPPCFPGGSESPSERKRLYEQMQMKLEQYLEYVIRSCFSEPRIIAVPIDPTSDQTVVIKNDSDPSLPIVFKSTGEILNYYSEGENPSITYAPQKNDAPSLDKIFFRNHWLERAVRDGAAVLDDGEIASAASFFHDVTFGFVRMNVPDSSVSPSVIPLFFVYVASS